MSIFKKVIDFDEIDQKYIINEDKIEKIFEPVKHSEISFITVSGKSKNAQILIVKFLIKILEDLFNAKSLAEEENFEIIDKSDDIYDSIKTESFTDSWIKEKKDDKSLWISEPFLVKRDEKSSYVYIMLSNGFDDVVHDKLWFIKQALASSVSSCLIFNNEHNIDEKFFSSLESSVNFSKAFEKTKNMVDENCGFLQTIVFILDSGDNFIRQNDYSNDEKIYQLLIDNNSSDTKTVDKFSFIEKNFQNRIPIILKKLNNYTVSNDFVDENYENFKEIISNNLHKILSAPNLNESINLNGEQCLHFIKGLLNILRIKSDSIIEIDHKIDGHLINYRDLKKDYQHFLSKSITNINFVPRNKLVNSHNIFIRNFLRSLFNNKELLNLETFNMLLFNFIDAFYSEFQIIFTKNEENRHKAANIFFKQCCDSFTEKIKIYNLYNFMNHNDFDEFLSSAENEAILSFKLLIGEEDKLLFENQFKQLITFIEEVKDNFNLRLSELKTIHLNNTQSIEQAINYFEKEIKNLFSMYPAIDKTTFKIKCDTFTKEATSRFVDMCFHGNESIKQSYKVEFAGLLVKSKDKYKLRIENRDNITIEQINQSCMLYKNKMDPWFDKYFQEEVLLSFHQNSLSDAISNFQENCLFKEKTYLEKFTQELINKLNSTFRDLKNAQTEKLKFSEEELENKLQLLKKDYVEAMKDSINENQFYETEEFSRLHKQTLKKSKEKIQINTKSDELQTEKYISKLVALITEEYDKLILLNSSEKEKYVSISHKIVNMFSKEYCDVMINAIKHTYMENEFDSLHLMHKNQAIVNFNKANPFNNKLRIEPFLKQINETIDKSSVELKVYFNQHIKNLNLELEKVLTEVTLYYKEEMNKLYENTTYMTKEKLTEHHNEIVRVASSVFLHKRHSLPEDKFKTRINFSLKKMLKPLIEENNKNTPTIPAIGIDLGTTNTVVAYYNPDSSKLKEIIIQNNGLNMTPSVVSFTSTEVLVGQQAKINSLRHRKNTISCIKRLIGRHFNDSFVQQDKNYLSYLIKENENNKPVIEVNTVNGYESYTPEQISAIILTEIKKIAETLLKVSINNAVITVPAYFNDSQKKATKESAILAGFNVFELMSEPVAAALAFKLNNTDKAKRKVLVYDLGGGTFDVAVLFIEKNKIDVKASKGDNHLGGEDFDNNLTEFCLNEFSKKTNIKIDKKTKQGEPAFYRLKLECEEYKKMLSSSTSTTIKLDNFFENTDLSVGITRETFENINKELFEKTIHLLKKTLEKANTKPSDVDDVILVGGSTKIPKIRRMLLDIFTKKQINFNINADEAVALGAAARAAILNGNHAQEFGHIKISKVAPMSLGVKQKNGYLTKIIEQNSRIPVKVRKDFQTVVDNQTEVEIVVIEGDEEMAVDNEKLDSFTLSDLPQGKAGEIIIEVTFDIKDDGILFVSAKARNTDISKEIRITSHNARLSNQELEMMIKRVKN